jgi:hypothetical protein
LLLALYQGLASAKPNPDPIFPKIKYAAKPRSNPAPAASVSRPYFVPPVSRPAVAGVSRPPHRP